MKTLGKAIMAGALALGTAGCDGLALTSAVDAHSEVVVAMTGDGEAEQTGGSTAATPSQEGSSSSGSGTASGQIDTKVRVYVQSSGGKWVELTKGAVGQSVEASGREGLRVISTAEVAARTYHRVRVEFHRVDANVTGGVYIGSSLLTGVVTVDAGSANKITVEREVTVDARSGGTIGLAIDLNASAWLHRASASARTVSAGDFASAVRITAR